MPLIFPHVNVVRQAALFHEILNGGMSITRTLLPGRKNNSFATTIRFFLSQGIDARYTTLTKLIRVLEGAGFEFDECSFTINGKCYPCVAPDGRIILDFQTKRPTAA